ncbi:SDR family NAD(P)-dependent oxidoreductase [Salinifilum aidingensis]
MSSSAPPTVLLTGATSGLGRALAEELVRSGARLVLHGRDRERAAAVRDELARSAGADAVDAVVADLARLHEVELLAGSVHDRCARLDVLIHNAGVGPADGGRSESADGIELRFAVNHLAGYHLTRLLQPLLVSSAPARVINVASAGQRPIDFDDPLLTTGYTGSRAYAQSKLAQIMSTFDLADELRPHGVLVNAVHPATYMNTPMVRAAEISPVSDVSEGVHAVRRLAFAPELAGTTGEYFHGVRQARALDQAYDAGARARLREVSDDLIRRAQQGSTAARSTRSEEV